MIEVTKREIILSIAIISVMVVLGLLIGGKINQSHEDDVYRYNKSLHVEDTDTFLYGMSTGVGDAFIKGEVVALRPVTFSELSSEKRYTKISKEKEVYTQHTRIVTTVDGDGNSHSEVEVYYTWDSHGTEYKQSDKINFLGVEFKAEDIKQMPPTKYIDTIYHGLDVRYIYRGSNIENDAIFFAYLKDDKMDVEFARYTSSTINELKEKLSENYGIYAFWFVWVLLICLSVYGFIYLDNRWLE